MDTKRRSWVALSGALFWWLVSAAMASAAMAPQEVAQPKPAAEPGHGAAGAASPEGHGTSPAGGAGAAAAAHHGPIQGELGFWTLFVFAGLLFVLSKFAWKPLAEALEAREKHIHDSVAEATKAREQAQALLAQHEQKMAEVQIEVRGIIDEARRDADRTRQDLIKQAHDEAESLRDRAQRDIERARDQALKELFETAGTVATDIAGRIVQQQLKPEDHRALVQRALAEMDSERN
jgi:F-type H+-transporting ATPase subunit b